MSRSFARAIALSAFALASLLLPARAEDRPATISALFLCGYEVMTDSMRSFVSTAKADLAASGRRCEIYTESLDLFRLPPAQSYVDTFIRYLNARYAKVPFDIIIAQSSGAFDLSLRFRAQRSPQLPIYCFELVDASVPERGLMEADTYGRVSTMVAVPTLLLAARLFPDARRQLVFTSISNPKYVAGFYATIAEARRRQPGLDFDVVLNPTFASLEAAIAAADPATPISLFLGNLAMPDGRSFSGGSLIERLYQDYPRPYFSTGDALFSSIGHGLMGGSPLDGARMGHEASAMILSILYGERKPDPRWAVSEPCVDIVDYRLLERFSVPVARLPPGTKLVNAPLPLWIAYEAPLKIAGSLLALACLALLMLLFVRKREHLILVENNVRLELAVRARTEDLSVANIELQAANQNLSGSLRRIEAMQERLVAETRESVLGRVAVSLAHEINNPLAAIGASLHSIRSVTSGDRDLMKLLAGMDGERLRSFFRLLSASRATAAREEGDGADRRRLLLARLSALGVESSGVDPGRADPSGLADLLAEARLDGLSDEDLASLCRPSGAPLLDALYLATLVESGVSVSLEAAGRIAEVVESIRSFALKVAEGPEGRRASLGESISGALLMHREAFAKDISVLLDLVEPAPFVAADETSLVRLWANLLQNAIQAMSGKGELRIESRIEGGFAVVSVLDSGPCVPAELRDRLFTPFASSGDPSFGLSLGLAICKRIVESFSGTIEACERDGRTAFVVRLPLAPDGPPE